MIAQRSPHRLAILSLKTLAAVYVTHCRRLFATLCLSACIPILQLFTACKGASSSGATHQARQQKNQGCGAVACCAPMSQSVSFTLCPHSPCFEQYSQRAR
eukprot:1537528-Alexandrium_andersonii.AAC.1